MGTRRPVATIETAIRCVMVAPRTLRGGVMLRRAIVTRRKSSFVAWVAVGTGGVFLVLALHVAALGAFVLGACCAYAARRMPR